MGHDARQRQHLSIYRQPICYVNADQLIPRWRGSFKLFRDHGNRADRKRAASSTVVHDWGVEKFAKSGHLTCPSLSCCPERWR